MRGHDPHPEKPGLVGATMTHARLPIAFSSLVEEARACTLCAAHLPLAPRPIFQLDPRARILIAGQAPGRKAHDSGVPFSDPSGDRLRAWLGVNKEVFYDASRIAILPMGFCFPGTGTGGDLPPRPECAATWRAKLLTCLPSIELTLVIGSYAQTWHLPDAKGQSVTEIVSSWRSHWPQTLPAPHPSPRNQRWLKANPWFETEVIPVLQSRVARLLAP